MAKELHTDYSITKALVEDDNMLQFFTTTGEWGSVSQMYARAKKYFSEGVADHRFNKDPDDDLAGGASGGWTEPQPPPPHDVTRPADHSDTEEAQRQKNEHIAILFEGDRGRVKEDIERNFHLPGSTVVGVNYITALEKGLQGRLLQALAKCCTRINIDEMHDHMVELRNGILHKICAAGGKEQVL
jgi:hypothetical protein